MNPDDLARIADPTIDEVFSEYLAAERERLSDRTFRRYQDVIEYLTFSLNGYAYQNLDEEDSALFERVYNDEGDGHREFTEIFGPEHIPGNVGEFLNYFMIRKVMAGGELLRAAGTVTKKLAKWLAANEYVDMGEAADVAERGAEAARDLPAAHSLGLLLDRHAETSVVFAETQEGYFTFDRIEGGKVWVEDLGVATYGPIPLPAEIVKECRVGWSFSGMIGRRGKTWYLAEVWNVYPHP